ncbi:class F sortase [Streptomyces sp. NBC_00344]|uniref:class F sortase n=1 Tax=Streptomyces sp. NBC_00344 TaxID=2975720 RepID=UPI002E216C3C
MTPDSDRARKRSHWGVVALVLLTGVALVRNGTEGSAPPQPDAASSAGRSPAVSAAARPGALPAAGVRRVLIPAIHVDAPVAVVGRDKDGWIEAPPPQNRNLAGWYRGAVSPGERGTAIVVGHVDNQSGPAVFFALGALRTGAHIDVLRTDGRRAVFDVYGISTFTKKNFPAGRVYGGTGRPELRVITCGGAYSTSTGYDGNVVVFARLSSVR